MILLAGASGYIGSRLLRRLEHLGVPVRCLARDPRSLRSRGFISEVFQADLLKSEGLAAAFADIETAYYLVHSMNDGPEFEQLERKCALHFAEAARNSGVRRIIYLGGLAQGDHLSPHMKSRIEVGEVLKASGIPVIEIRASVVIGSGSASFEMIRSLVEKLPVMITPRWVRAEAQPIAIEDVTEYLLQAREVPLSGSMIVEIGGRDVTSYLGIMQEFARQRGLRRKFIQVPFLSLSLSSRWLTLVTPLHKQIGKHLIESVRHPSIVVRPTPAVFTVRPMGVQEAISRALRNEDTELPDSRWSDASGGHSGVAVESLTNTLRDKRTIQIPLPPELAFVPIQRIGGTQGWYFSNSLWRIRGLIDMLMGGVGMRRGRPNPETPLVGGTLDFWRVEAYEPGHRLLLRAEMKVPGHAWLEFVASPTEGGTELQQTAHFAPVGPLGRLYWYMLWPVHVVMFTGMLRRIKEDALFRAQSTVHGLPSKIRTTASVLSPLPVPNLGEKKQGLIAETPPGTLR
ncbi:MAG: SDR family oxidoreductase [Bryobacteraceae bacterium]